MHTFRFIIIIFLFGIIVQSNAQITNGLYPTAQDSIECLQLISVYKHSIAQKDYEQAIGPWRKALQKCPGSNLSLYIDGVKILKNKIENEKSKALRSRYIDTLLFVYDQRVKYFGHDPLFSTAYIFGLMGLDLQQYRPDAFDEAYHYLSQCLTGQQKQTLPSVLAGLLKSAVAMYQAGKLSADSVTIYYKTSVEIAAGQLKSTVSSDKREMIADAINQLEDNYLSAGIIDCNMLIQTLQPRFDAAPHDPKVLKRIAVILDKGKCYSTPLFNQVSEKLYAFDSTANNALLIARKYVENNNAQSAIGFYKKALMMEKDSSKKANILIEAADNLYQRFNKYNEAKLYILTASAFRPKWSQPYLSLAKLYIAAAASYSQDPFQNRMLYWAAADKLDEALKLNPNLKPQIEKEIKLVSEKFPRLMEIAVNGYKLGETITIKGWVSEITIVRARKE